MWQRCLLGWGCWLGFGGPLAGLAELGAVEVRVEVAAVEQVREVLAPLLPPQVEQPLSVRRLLPSALLGHWDDLEQALEVPLYDGLYSLRAVQLLWQDTLQQRFRLQIAAHFRAQQIASPWDRLFMGRGHGQAADHGAIIGHGAWRFSREGDILRAWNGGEWQLLAPLTSDESGNRREDGSLLQASFNYPRSGQLWQGEAIFLRPEEGLGLLARGHLRGRFTGMAPLTLPHMPDLPAGQALVLALGLAGDGQLAPWLHRALVRAWSASGLADPGDAVLSMAGTIILSYGMGPDRPLLSTAIPRGKGGDALLAALLGTDIPESQEPGAVQLIEDGGDDAWWLREHHGWWWLSQDQILLTQVSGALVRPASMLSALEIRDGAMMVAGADPEAMSDLIISHFGHNDENSELPSGLAPLRAMSRQLPALSILSLHAMDQDASTVAWQWQEPLMTLIQGATAIQANNDLRMRDALIAGRARLQALHQAWSLQRAEQGEHPEAPHTVVIPLTHDPLPNQILAVEDPLLYNTTAAMTLVLFADGTIAPFYGASTQDLFARAQRLASIAQTGHWLDEPWGPLAPTLAKAYEEALSSEPQGRR